MGPGRKNSLPHEDDQSGKTVTLPRAELNPMLNPVLGQNMGRWAEAYFTAPPEKREEAVQELLREIEKENSTPIDPPAIDPAAIDPPATDLLAEKTQEVSQPRLNPQAHADSSEIRIVEISTADDPLADRAQADRAAAETPMANRPLVEHAISYNRCPHCGHSNPAPHLFCGVCGTRLADDASASESREVFESAPNAIYTSDDSAFDEPVRMTNEFVQAEDSFAAEPFSSWMNPRPPAYRSYIATALVIVVFVLAYVLWRRQAAPQSNKPTATENSVAANDPSRSTQPVESRPASSTTEPATPAEHNRTAAPDVAAPDVAAPVKAAEKAPLPSSKGIDSAAPPAGAGNEELETAQRYLNGTDGPRNSPEAAKWLWKSIAKHNGAATLLLADLYLKGDGVAKNCDQARVLLDSAARKGVSGAGERLRNLAAFGCQ
jgi:hypothetical protein